MADKYLCRAEGCGKLITATKNHRYRTHTNQSGDPCGNNSEPIPEDLKPDSGDPGTPKVGMDFNTCPECGRSVKLTRLGYFENHNATLYGGERCGTSGVRLRSLQVVEDVPLPGDELPEKGVYRAQSPKVTAQQEVEAATAEPALVAEGISAPQKNLELTPMSEEDRGKLLEGELEAKEVATFLQPGDLPSLEKIPPESVPSAGSSASTTASSPASETTSKPLEGPETEPSKEGPFSLGTSFSVRFLQPFSPFLQPPKYEGPMKPEPMNGKASEIAVRFKEIFYSHSNRRSADNRSAQTTLGPSEIGTPCDRRLAMSLMGVEPVNPGGDGWAAWMGTQGHAGLELVFTWASANTGRFVTEARLELPSKHVPYGTSDLYDRVEREVWDFKFMGAYSLKKFKSDGPSETYRTQGQVYGLGQELAGEKPKRVVIVGLPRAGNSLDEMHVWTEPYSRKTAQAALDRVDRIAEEAFSRGSGPHSKLEVAQEFSAGDDCRYCPFHRKGDEGFTRGCPGK